MECSWSQFVIILWCLSLGKPEEIPILAFNISDGLDRLRADIGMASEARSTQHLVSSPTRPMSPQGSEWESAPLTTGDDEDSFFETTRRPTSSGSNGGRLRDSPIGTPGKPAGGNTSRPRTSQIGGIAASSPSVLDQSPIVSRHLNHSAPASFENMSRTQPEFSAREKAKHQPISLATKFR